MDESQLIGNRHGASSHEDAVPERLEWHSRTRLIDEIAQVLRERIYAGRYVPGEALRQVQIATELKVSRTPLREALRMLEMEGILKAVVGGGVCVVRADYRRLIDAYLLREVIDALAARLATERLEAASADRLFALIEVQRRAVEPWLPVAYTKANVEFHAAIIAMAQNEFLTGQMPIVRMTSQIFSPWLMMDNDRAVDAIKEHVAIADAIATGDAEKAQRLGGEHIRRTIIRLQRKFGVAGAPVATGQTRHG
jgi:DNA-binding GntR family transcriptional regulator